MKDCSLVSDQMSSITNVASQSVSDRLPIAVDLDGTFLHVDTLHEGLAQLLLRRPWTVFLALLALLRGKASLKAFVALHMPLDAQRLPVNQSLLIYLEEEKRKGRSILLFSAADQSTVDSICVRYPVFDSGFGSSGRLNLSGDKKLQAIREKLGDHFVYAGNSKIDLKIWKYSQGAIFVGSEGPLMREVARLVAIERSIPSLAGGIRVWLKALRAHQWSKNFLVFIPAALTVPQLTITTIFEFIFAFVALCAGASGTYLINDLLDVNADRHHRLKRERPMAIGSISLLDGLMASFLMFILAVIACFSITKLSATVVGAYIFVSLAYSFALKRIALLDTITLGGLFTARIAVGAAILRNDPPYWLFAFSMFFFTSLAFVKRHAELVATPAAAFDRLLGRGYAPVDLPLVIAAGVGSALCSIVVFLIYLGGQEFDRSLFGDPAWLGIVPIAAGYWILRIWMLTLRNEMQEDPVLFALHDATSYVVAGFVGLSLLLAW